MNRRWVIGDIHGCINTFRKMMEGEISPSPDDTIYLLGDLMDRGPNSKAVIDYIFSLYDQSIDVRVIRGNHEVMLLEAVRSEEKFALWMMNGGMATLKSFSVDCDLFIGPKAVAQIPDQYIEFFSGLPWYLETEGYFLVHAGLNPVSPDPLNDTDAMIWTRQEGYNAKFLHGRKLVHGHSAIHLEAILHNIYDQNALVYNLDGGCVYRNDPGLGSLVGWELNTGSLKIVPNQE